MKIIAVIPARYNSTRFPAKLMQDLCGKPVILRTYEAAVNTGIFNEVIVATDSSEIFDVIWNNGGKAVMSQKKHESGSDRIAEAVSDIDADIVVNVQGDEPFVSEENLIKLVDIFKQDTEQKVDVASLMFRITECDAEKNPNHVKVVTDNDNFALYFSRSPIPFNRDGILPVDYYQHIGVYAFRKSALMAFTQWKTSTLENIENLEQLRYLENGKRIRMALVEKPSIGIDTPEDLEKAIEFLKGN